MCVFKCSSTVRFQPIQSIPVAKLDDPAAISLIFGSVHFISLAASSANLPYSSALRWPICHGPSISLPRPQYVTFQGSARPFFFRSASSPCRLTGCSIPPTAAASVQLPVPRFTATYGSVSSVSAYSGIRGCRTDSSLRFPRPFPAVAASGHEDRSRRANDNSRRSFRQATAGESRSACVQHPTRPCDSRLLSDSFEPSSKTPPSMHRPGAR